MTFVPLSLPRLRTLPLPSLFAGLLAIIGQRLSLPHRRLMLQQQLEALPDRMLTDVGIERGDLPQLIRRG